MVKLRIMTVKNGGDLNSKTFSRDISSKFACNLAKLTSEAFPDPPVESITAVRNRGINRSNCVVSLRNPS